jgi:hypothetical protein
VLLNQESHAMKSGGSVKPILFNFLEVLICKTNTNKMLVAFLWDSLLVFLPRY